MMEYLQSLYKWYSGSGVSFFQLQANASIAVYTFFVLGVALIQKQSAGRYREFLNSVVPSVKKTAYWDRALGWVERRLDISTAPGIQARLPILFLAGVIGGCAYATFYGADLSKNDAYQSLTLGAACLDSPSHFLAYQRNTLLTGSMAFLGAFVWVIRRLIERVNNNDASPSTYYFLAARVISACLIAGVVRHLLVAISFAENVDCDLAASRLVWLAPLGFVIGLRPYLWLDEIAKVVMDFWRGSITHEKTAATESERPESGELTLIDGLTLDRIERLSELDIDNCEKLSRENPLVLWLRTTYTLEQIVDWMAQAYLYSFLPNKLVKILSKYGIRDIFGYWQFIQEPFEIAEAKEYGTLCISTDLANLHRRILNECSVFQSLKQIGVALSPADPL